ncbi:translation initiation factor IF-2 [Spirochaetia bacterium]|nr:translation initiation factor IF-2 [Spirochaetia bacterium]
MAQETDNTQKPKVELIKRSKEPEESTKTDTAERKKVVIVKKRAAPPQKNRAQEGAASSVPEKPASKVTVVARNETVPASEKPSAAETKESDVILIKTTPKPDAAPENNAAEKKTTPAGTAVSAGQVSFLAPTQRPAVQAGRVGGKFIGPKPPRADGERRPAAYSKTGARGGTNAKTGSAPFNNEGGYAGRAPYQGGGVQTGGGSGGYQGGRGQGGFNRQQTGAPHTGGGFNRQGNDSAGGRRPYQPGGNTGGQGFQRPPFQRQGGGFGGRPGVGNNAAQPLLPLDGKTPGKRAFKAKKPVYQRRDKELEMEAKLLQTKKRVAIMANPVPKSIDIMEVISVSELARKMNLKASDLIAKLMSMGMMVTINQQIDSETATLLAAEFGADVKIVSLYDETLIETENDDAETMTPRPPVVTVMGHVDHGKTKLLDAIRSADVVSGEFGGITQHIGAYMVETPMGNITFLDTPGHEAFTRMRSRGAQVTDIVVLVVAADDGVMPQTIEAINHAKEADVPIIVAVNKMDKPEANPDRVKSQLSELGLQPEEWGGQTMFVELSALKKTGIDKLIEAILLQAEILDLRANYNRSAEGKILESRIDHGRGIVATIMLEKGTLEIGDSFVAGVWPGKVRAIFNDKGKKIEEATPAMPVEVLGFEGIPNAGDPLQVVEDEKTARGFSAKRQELKRFEDAKNVRKITLDNLYDTISEGDIQELKVIIKGDVQGSVEALRASLEKLSTKEVRLNVIQALPGAINEGDVNLAAASNAILIGFNVRPTPKAKALADQEKVDVRRYNIIYRVVEEMQQAMEGMLKPDTKEEVIANVEVRNVFKMSKSGIIAGCYVLHGTVKRSASVNVIRNDTVIHTGKIASLRRFKDDVKEVASGFECGMGIDNFEDVKVGDELEVFEIVEVARHL